MIEQTVGYFAGVRVVVDHGGPAFALNPGVPLSDAFREEMQRWCIEFFGYRPGVVDEGKPIRGYLGSGESFYLVHPADYQRLRELHPKNSNMEKL